VLQACAYVLAHSRLRERDCAVSPEPCRPCFANSAPSGFVCGLAPGTPRATAGSPRRRCRSPPALPGAGAGSASATMRAIFASSSSRCRAANDRGSGCATALAYDPPCTRLEAKCKICKHWARWLLREATRRRLFTTADAARAAGCSQATILRALQRGELEGFRLGPSGDHRVPSDALARWLRPAGPGTDEEGGGTA
jgi:excisionase family DNA binding protein